ncbi:MAG: alpha/beta hydrolase-fold protein [Balneolaceae bacterium]|nr:alpha/beta hydrolase-fold protein [Balneolaceae bacterium]
MDSLYSNYLDEYRLFNVYLPPNYDENEDYPIIYATDGERSIAGSRVKSLLDSLIQHTLIEPLIYVGSHANHKKIGSGTFMMHYRFYEYVDNDTDLQGLEWRFKNHMKFFTQELIPEIEDRYIQNGDDPYRLFYGSSNGAGFGSSMLNRYPELIDTYILFSTLGSKVENKEWRKDISYPELYLKYGSEEKEAFKKEANLLAEKYRQSNSSYELKVYEGGHDHLKWHEEFEKTLVEIFKGE